MSAETISDCLAGLLEQLAAKDAEIARLREYATHQDGCQAGNSPPYQDECICGFSDDAPNTDIKPFRKGGRDNYKPYTHTEFRPPELNDSTWEDAYDAAEARAKDLEAQLAQTALTVTRLEADLKLSYRREDNKHLRAVELKAERDALRLNRNMVYDQYQAMKDGYEAAANERDRWKAEVEKQEDSHDLLLADLNSEMEGMEAYIPKLQAALRQIRDLGEECKDDFLNYAPFKVAVEIARAALKDDALMDEAIASAGLAEDGE